MDKQVYFVRHGESDSNADGIVRGHAASLSEKGKTQAEIVAKRIKRISVDALVSSPFSRTHDTAKAISEEIGLEIELNELFVERRRPSSTIGKSMRSEETKQIMGEIFDGYLTETYKHSDEENFSQLRARANAAWEFLANHPKENICVVTHGLFLRILFCAAVHGPNFSGRDLQDFFRSAETDNTGVSHFILQDDIFSKVPRKKWILKNWNDSAHLG